MKKMLKVLWKTACQSVKLIVILLFVSVFFSLGIYVEKDHEFTKKHKESIDKYTSLAINTCKTKYESMSTNWNEFQVKHKEKSAKKKLEKDAKKKQEEKDAKELAAAKAIEDEAALEKKIADEANDIAKITKAVQWAEYYKNSPEKESIILLNSLILEDTLIGGLNKWISTCNMSGYSPEVEEYILAKITSLCLTETDWDTAYKNSNSGTKLGGIAKKKRDALAAEKREQEKEIAAAEVARKTKLEKAGTFAFSNLELIELSEKTDWRTAKKLSTQLLETNKEKSRKFTFNEKEFHIVIFVDLSSRGSKKYSLVIYGEELILCSGASSYKNSHTDPIRVYIKATNVYLEKDHVEDFTPYVKLHQDLIIAFYEEMIGSAPSNEQSIQVANSID